MQKENVDGRKLVSKLRRLEREHNRNIRKLRSLRDAKHMLEFLEERDFDVKCIDRLDVDDFVEVFTKAYAYNYFDEDTEDAMAAHWIWSCQWAKELAYEQLGRRRLAKKNRTREMVACIMSMHATRVGSFFFRDGHFMCVRFPRLSCFMDVRDEESVSCFLAKLEEYGKEMTYKKFNSKRVLLTGWRLASRMSQNLRGQ